MSGVNSEIIIACDVGLKRIGLAILLNSVILPCTAILRKNRNQAARDLSNFLKEKNADALVVGLPKSNAVDSENSDTQRRIKHFVSLLDFSGQTFFVDESYTSAQAFENLAHMKRQARADSQKDGKLDSLAACEILKIFLDSENFRI